MFFFVSFGDSKPPSTSRSSPMKTTPGVLIGKKNKIKNGVKPPPPTGNSTTGYDFRSVFSFVLNVHSVDWITFSVEPQLRTVKSPKSFRGK